MLPHKLKNFNVFNDGQNFLGQVSEIALPKLSAQMEEYRGAGMLGPVDIDMGLEKLEMEATYGGLVVPVLRQFGVTAVDGVMLRFIGAYQSDGAGQVKQAELVVRGRHKEIDPGSAKAGDDTEWKVSSSLSYLKWTIDARVEVEIDLVNCIYLIGGFDRMAQIRAAIGADGGTLGAGISVSI
ncbi:MAG TPA: phage major tail tube protein [Allosphingosinicella sp.]|jgi:hypothetical protein